MDPELPITIINQASAWTGWLPAATGIVGTALGGLIAARTAKVAAQRQWASQSYDHTRDYFGEISMAVDHLYIHLNLIVTKYEKARADGVKSAFEQGRVAEGGKVDFRVEQTPDELKRSSETLTRFRDALARSGLYGKDIHDKFSAVDEARAVVVEALNEAFIDTARRELEIFDTRVQILRRGTMRDLGIHSLVVLNNLAPRKERKSQRKQTLATIAEIDRLDAEALQKIKVLQAKPKDTSPVRVGKHEIGRMQ